MGLREIILGTEFFISFKVKLPGPTNGLECEFINKLPPSVVEMSTKHKFVAAASAGAASAFGVYGFCSSAVSTAARASRKAISNCTGPSGLSSAGCVTILARGL